MIKPSRDYDLEWAKAKIELAIIRYENAIWLNDLKKQALPLEEQAGVSK